MYSLGTASVNEPPLTKWLISSAVTAPLNLPFVMFTSTFVTSSDVSGDASANAVVALKVPPAISTLISSFVLCCDTATATFSAVVPLPFEAMLVFPLPPVIVPPEIVRVPPLTSTPTVEPEILPPLMVVTPSIAG